MRSSFQWVYLTLQDSRQIEKGSRDGTEVLVGYTCPQRTRVGDDQRGRERRASSSMFRASCVHSSDSRSVIGVEHEALTGCASTEVRQIAQACEGVGAT